MTIAINSNYFLPSGANAFFYESLLRFVVLDKANNFVFIIPPALCKTLHASKNITVVVSAPRTDNPLLWKLWLNHTLPRICRRYKSDILLNTGGTCSLRTKIPQIVCISDLAFIDWPTLFSKRQLKFLQRNSASFLNKAKKIVTASAFVGKEVMQHYPETGKKICTIPLATGDQYHPVGYDIKEVVKERYAEGKEYFLFSGEIHQQYDVVNLLKAFSFFKKRQKSNMQLIITTSLKEGISPVIENFNSYKFRNEVKILNGLPEEELAKVIATAYAFIYPVVYDGNGIAPLHAMQCGVPVITSDIGVMKEVTGEAAVYADPNNFQDMADKMMMVFKDENMRAEMIKKSLLQVQLVTDSVAEYSDWESVFRSIG